MDHYLAYSFIIDRSIFPPAVTASFGELATRIIAVLTLAAGILAFIFIILSGFKFVTAGGDPKKLAGAQATMTYAIIGIIVAILAFVILQVVQFMLQSNVAVT